MCVTRNQEINEEINTMNELTLRAMILLFFKMLREFVAIRVRSVDMSKGDLGFKYKIR